MAKKGKIFNQLKRPKLLRKGISAGETLVGVFLLVVIFGMSFWLGAQRDNYDPSERDIDTALLIKQSVEDNLYRIPLKRWRDPSLGGISEAPVPLGPFPASVLEGGWAAVSSPQNFDADTLFEKINGQADQYLKFGFEELTVIPIENPDNGRFLDFFLYDQGSFKGSLGVYQEQRGNRDVISVQGVHYTPSPLGAIGMCGRYFFHATGDAPDPLIESMAIRFIDAVRRLDQRSPPPPEFLLLNLGMGLSFQEIAFQPSNVFQYRFASDFWFGKMPDTENARVFLHGAKSPDAARELHDRLHSELLEDYDPLDSQSPGLLLQHRFLKTHFALKQHQNYLLGVERHPERQEAIDLLERLLSVLPKADIEEDVGREEGYPGEGEGGYR